MGQDSAVDISGIVLSMDGPLAGVNIRVKDSDWGTQTDDNGEFSIQARPNDVLIFSFIGMETVDFKVPLKSDRISITMVRNTNKLDEVTVRGRAKKVEIQGMPNKPETIQTNFGTEDLRSRGYSVYYIDGNNLNEAYDPKGKGWLKAIAAKLPGGIKSGLGRSTNSLNISSNALIEIDGVLYTQSPPMINIADIEEVFVLRSLAATVRYGEMGKGGVVIIKTNRDPNRISKSSEGESLLNKEIFQKDAIPYSLKYIEYEKAARLSKPGFTNFVKNLDDDITELRYLAYACQAAEEHERAIQVYRQILALLPEDTLAIRDLAHALAISGRPEMAWSTYLGRADNNLGQFSEALSGIEFQEMINLYKTENLRTIFPNAIDDSNAFEGMKEPITRVVLEWANPDHAFTIEAVNPRGQVSRTAISSSEWKTSIEELYLDSTLKGEWQFNLDLEESQSETIVLKVSIYRNWGKEKVNPEIKLFKFNEEEILKYKLFTLKV